MLFAKLDGILKRFEELEKLTIDEEVVQNIQLYQKYAKEIAGIRDIATKYRLYRSVRDEIAALKEETAKHAGDEAYSALIVDEIKSLEEKASCLDRELEDDIFENIDTDSNKNIIMEIRAGTGGVEAALFAGDLFRMYSKYAAKKGWAVDIMSMSTTEKNGIKEVIFSVNGKGVYGRMKYESGTHRVQRVPETEASGRIHTSAATVAVLPEAEEIDLKINPQDLKIEVCRAGGAGGQHVNKTESAVRMIHIPTGIEVNCADERSQHKNKAKALRILRTRVYELMRNEQASKISETRKLQVGSGDRSEKIRTYNFPDSRVTDHRIGFTLHALQDVMEGDLDEVMDALKEEERKKRRGAV